MWPSWRRNTVATASRRKPNPRPGPRDRADVACRRSRASRALGRAGGAAAVDGFRPAALEDLAGGLQAVPREGQVRLRPARLEDGKRIKIKILPMPTPVVFQGQRLPASYASFYVSNRAVLVPTFNDPNDRIALNALAETYPKHKIVGIYCGDFIWGLGAIHCMTQQEPAL